MTALDRRTVLVGTSTALLLSGTRLFAQTNAKVDRGGFLALNGVEQWVTVRGSDRANPLVVVLGGGPGVPISYLAPALAAWEQDFTVALWDQPGSGATFMKNGGVAGLGEITVDRFARDGIALVETLQEQLVPRSVILLGYSWGSMVGLEMIARRPDLFGAYLGSGQNIDVRRADALSYTMALEAARRRADQPAITALEGIGPPPFTFERRLVKQQYATAATDLERTRTAELGRALAAAPKQGSWVWPDDLGQYDAGGAFITTLRASFDDAQAWSAAALGNAFKVPLVFAQGEHDINAVAELVRELIDRVDAPHKELIVIPGAGHGTFPNFQSELLAILSSQIMRHLPER